MWNKNEVYVSWLICLFLEWCFIKPNPMMFLVNDITRKWDLPNMHKACGASECEHARSMGYLSIEDSLYSPDARWCNFLSILFVVLLAATDILFSWMHCDQWCWNEFRLHWCVCMVCFYYYVCCVVCVGIVGCCCVFCCELALRVARRLMLGLSLLALRSSFYLLGTTDEAWPPTVDRTINNIVPRL